MDKDYELIARISEEQVQIRFGGQFEGRPVSWQATIQTLRDFHRSTRGACNPCRQFIDISKKGDEFHLSIGLNIPVVDEAAIKKSIIMIRKYKRLHIGRHEYGDWVAF